MDPRLGGVYLLSIVCLYGCGWLPGGMEAVQGPGPNDSVVQSINGSTEVYPHTHTYTHITLRSLAVIKTRKLRAYKAELPP